ncbi:MAG TPA: sugar phosphate isomerase/epimerase family protein [Pirellulaceae bacterium]|nr:sugar phosphate isomerase/epimerase family protein [Pirellulaceae bacterium]
MKSAITISLVTEARGGPFVFSDLPGGCRQAKELGFEAVEIFPPSADAVRELRVDQFLAGEGLKLAAMGTGAGWLKNKWTLTSPDASIRNQACAFVRSLIDVAGPLGAPVIIGSLQGRWGDTATQEKALGWLSESLNQLGAQASQYNVPLLFEPLNRYETNMCNTIADGVELIKSMNTKNVLLLADLFHMNIEEVDIAAALRAGGKHIGHVHFVDSNRRPAGAGHLDYGPIVAALRDINYTGYLSAEALPWPDPAAAAKQTIEQFNRLTSL